MTNERYFSFQQRISDAATVEQLDEVADEIKRDFNDDRDFESLLDSYVHVRILMQIEDGEEPRNLMQD